MVICPALFLADYIESSPVILGGLLAFMLLLTFQVRATNWSSLGRICCEFLLRVYLRYSPVGEISVSSPADTLGTLWSVSAQMQFKALLGGTVFVNSSYHGNVHQQRKVLSLTQKGAPFFTELGLSVGKVDLSLELHNKHLKIYDLKAP